MFILFSHRNIPPHKFVILNYKRPSEDLNPGFKVRNLASSLAIKAGKTRNTRQYVSKLDYWGV